MILIARWTRDALLVSGMAALVAGCSSLGSTGPRAGQILKTEGRAVQNSPIRIVNLDAQVVHDVAISYHQDSFAQTLGEAPPARSIIGRGDSLAVSIYEAPPALLFGSQAQFGQMAGGAVIAPSASSSTTALPPTMVDDDGNISVPFAGKIHASGRTVDQIAAQIRSRLIGKANNPQVLVTLAENANRTVTVVGESQANLRYPLTPHGERLLDVLAGAQGVKQPVDKTTIQITRGKEVVSMPLRAVIADPTQNIRLEPNDVVTALFQANSFTALGAMNLNAEVPFENTGISLSQALGRIQGLRDDRADIRGIFIFRYEKPQAIGVTPDANTPLTPDGRIPVIYRLDLTKAETFFLAQNFPMRDKDVLYVSTAPLVDFQKFLSVATQMAYTVINIGNQIR